MRAATVAICLECWRKEEGERDPVRMRERHIQTCYRCKQITLSGIYVRRMIKTPTKKGSST